MKRSLVLSLVAACSHATWNSTDASAPTPDAAAPIFCETTTTCTLACDTSSTFTTIGCDSVVPARCTSSSDESESYGCTLSCDHEARIVAQCDDDTR